MAIWTRLSVSPLWTCVDFLAKALAAYKWHQAQWVALPEGPAGHWQELQLLLAGQGKGLEVLYLSRSIPCQGADPWPCPEVQRKSRGFLLSWEPLTEAAPLWDAESGSSASPFPLLQAAQEQGTESAVTACTLPVPYELLTC